ncbi:MAG: TonB family protein [Acidobacteriia bacterium]|nr:TonB family protein [Terriglobia bacterium]
METVVPPPADAELHLLTEWREPGSASRTRKAAVGSVLAHIGVLTLLSVLPSSIFGPAQPPVEKLRQVTPLIAPLTELTQKDPNTGKVRKEFDTAEARPRPRVQIPFVPPPAPKPRPAEIPPLPAAKPPAPLPEAPKLEAAAKEPPKIELPAAAPPPRIQADEKPPLALENVGQPPPPVPPNQRRVAVPNPSVSDAIRHASPGINDPGSQAHSGYGSGVNPPQLLSDPRGVDFRPYLKIVLDSVRRHWTAVMPDSVRMGLRGQVSIVFSITRDGNVGKLVIATSSGNISLDRAAVVGVDAAHPFPQLPSEFRGDEIRLQFNFSYNMPKQ